LYLSFYRKRAEDLVNRLAVEKEEIAALQPAPTDEIIFNAQNNSYRVDRGDSLSSNESRITAQDRLAQAELRERNVGVLTDLATIGFQLGKAILDAGK
jgi:hypothetical protein